jgi:hypothetical protein
MVININNIQKWKDRTYVLWSWASYSIFFELLYSAAEKEKRYIKI